MTNWTTAINDPLTITDVGPTGSYLSSGLNLSYSGINDPIIPSGTPIATNYALAFSSTQTIITTGQLWPRGQGNRI